MGKKIKNYGLIGKNINYSFSKDYFNDKFKNENIINTSYNNFDLEEIKDKYTLSFLLGSRIKIKSISVGLRYERGLNTKEILILNANGANIEDANVDLTTNKLSLNISYDIPYNLFKKKN